MRSAVDIYCKQESEPLPSANNLMGPTDYLVSGYLCTSIVLNNILRSLLSSSSRRPVIVFSWLLSFCHHYCCPIIAILIHSLSCHCLCCSVIIIQPSFCYHHCHSVIIILSSSSSFWPVVVISITIRCYQYHHPHHLMFVFHASLIWMVGKELANLWATLGSIDCFGLASVVEYPS